MKKVLSTLLAASCLVMSIGCSSLKCGDAKTGAGGEITVIVDQEIGGNNSGRLTGRISSGLLGTIANLAMGLVTPSNKEKTKDELIAEIDGKLKELAARKSKEGCKECPRAQPGGDMHCTLSYKLTNDKVEVSSIRTKNEEGKPIIRYTIKIPPEAIVFSCSLCQGTCSSTPSNLNQEKLNPNVEQRTCTDTTASHAENTGTVSTGSSNALSLASSLSLPDGRAVYIAPAGSTDTQLSINITYRGDANGDGYVDSDDILAVQNGQIRCPGAIAEFASLQLLALHVQAMEASSTRLLYAKRGGMAGCSFDEQNIYVNLK